MSHADQLRHLTTVELDARLRSWRLFRDRCFPGADYDGIARDSALAQAPDPTVVLIWAQSTYSMAREVREIAEQIEQTALAIMERSIRDGQAPVTSEGS